MTANLERTWAEIGFVVLEAHERTASLPEDTKAVPYYARVKGFAPAGTMVGDDVEVETLIGRTVRGEVLAVGPAYSHTFGAPVPALIAAGLEARELLRQVETRERAQQ